MDIPKWEKPAWTKMSPDQIRNMSEREIRGVLKEAMHVTKALPDSVPWKKDMMALGQIAIKINDLFIKLEEDHTLSEEQQEAIKSEVHETLKKGSELMIRVLGKMSPDKIQQIRDIVEIIDNEKYEDPWSSEPFVPVEPENHEPINQTPSDYDPWAIANEF